MQTCMTGHFMNYILAIVMIDCRVMIDCQFCLQILSLPGLLRVVHLRFIVPIGALGNVTVFGYPS